MGALVASDVEGTLTAGSQWKGIARYLVRHGRALAYRAFFLTHLPAAYLARLGLIAEQPFRDRWIRGLARPFRGLDAAAIRHLAAWVVEDELWPARREHVLAELERHRRAGRRVALVSAMYQPVLEELARRIGAEAYGTALEMRGGRATGRLLGAVNSGGAKAQRLRQIVGRDTLVAAYGDTAADIPLLEAAAEPVAVHPDGTLRQLASERGWRVLAG